MTPYVQQMTAAAMIPAAMAVETWARLVARSARQWSVMLSPAPAAPVRPEEGLSDVQAEVMDRAAEAMEAEAEAVETAATHIADEARDARNEAEATAGTDGDGPAGLRPVDGTLTAADAVVEAIEPAPAEAAGTEAVVEEATGRAPRSLEEMIPANDHPH